MTPAEKKRKAAAQRLAKAAAKKRAIAARAADKKRATAKRIAERKRATAKRIAERKRAAAERAAATLHERERKKRAREEEKRNRQNIRQARKNPKGRRQVSFSFAKPTDAFKKSYELSAAGYVNTAVEQHTHPGLNIGDPPVVVYVVGGISPPS